MRSTGAVHQREPIDERPLKLRSHIEKWERDGLIRPEVAAQALSSEPRQVDTPFQPTALRRAEVIGYFGAVPVAAAGVLLAISQVGIGSILLIGLLIAVASPRSIRASTMRAADAPGHGCVPRHRANSPNSRIATRGPKAREVAPNDRSGACGQTTTLASTDRC